MSTTVTYKGSVLTIVNNQTRVMKTAGKYMEDDVTLVDTPVSPNLESKSISITPSESAQSQTVSPGSGYDGLSSVSVSVSAIPSTYVGTGIARRDSSDLTALGATVSVPAGYYQNAVSKSIANGTEGTPIATKGTVSGHSISITPSVTNTAGYISGGSHSGTPVSVSASELVSGNLAINNNGNNIDVTNYATVSVSVSPTLRSVTKTYTPSESSQSETISPGTGYDGLSSVSITVDPISSTYVGSGITRRDSTDLTTSGATVSVPSGYYENPASKSVSSGSMGTPVATKGTVNNHSILVTPSVTNTAGYILGGTVNGTAVSVSASELVSGSETKTANGTYDVTNLATLIVNVSGGGGALPLLHTEAIGSISTTSTSGTDTGKTVTLTSSTNFTDYDLLIVDISVNTATNGRHTSTVSMVLLTGTSNVNTKNTYTVVTNKWNSKLSSNGTGSTRQSGSAYGIYINTVTVSSNTMTMAVYRRYNSSNTGTINGTYTARVYGVKLYDLIGGQ